MDLKYPFSLLPFNIIVPISILFLFFLYKFVNIVGRFKSQKFAIVKKLPPGPWMLPVLVGSLLHMFGGPLPFRTLKYVAMIYGPLMHFQLGRISAVLISSPRLAKEVFKTHDLAMASRPSIVGTQTLIYNTSDLIFAPFGDYWRQMRKICSTELLCAKKVGSFSSIREDEVWNLIESIHLSISSSTGKSPPLNLTEKLNSLINNIVCRSTFGNKCKDQASLLECIEEARCLGQRFDVADIFPSSKWLHVICGMRPKLQKLHHKFDQIISAIVNEGMEKANTGGDHTGDHEDLLHALIKLNENGGHEFPLTLINVKAVLMDILVAGTDSSSATIEWAMAEMIRNPRVMEKAQSDLRQALKGKNVVYETDIKELDYLKLVLKETLRLHPPVPLLVPRECREECEIDGFNIPVGTKMFVNIWAIGRDPEYWKDAERFYPERFENNSVDFIGDSFEFIPFGGGRRMCPGMKFGLANIELALAQLLYHFNWKLPNGMKPENLDMTESFGANAIRKSNLCLVATPQIPPQYSR